MKLTFTASESYDNIDWHWSADNGRGLVATGTAVTFRGAVRKARRAMRRIAAITREIPHPGLLGIPEEEA